MRSWGSCIWSISKTTNESYSISGTADGNEHGYKQVWQVSQTGCADSRDRDTISFEREMSARAAAKVSSAPLS